MQFLKKTSKNEYLVLNDLTGREAATHVITENGKMHEINKMISNFPDNDFVYDGKVPEPLGLPTLNFEKKEEQKKTIENNNGTPEGLPLPAMTF